MLVELVMRLKPCMNVKAFQQNAASPSVLRQYQIYFFQNLDCSESHVIQVAYGRRHYEQLACHDS